MNDQLFGQTGLNVSQIALRTGNFGTGWGYGASSEEAKLMLNAYLNAVRCSYTDVITYFKNAAFGVHPHCYIKGITW